MNTLGPSAGAPGATPDRHREGACLQDLDALVVLGGDDEVEIGHRDGELSEGNLVLALGLVVLFITPVWALALAALRSPRRLRLALSRSASLRLLASAAVAAVAGLGAIGPLWVRKELIPPSRPELQGLVTVGTVVQSVVLGLLMILAASRAEPAAAPAAESTVRRKPYRAIAVVLIAWVLAAGSVVALAVGPLSGQPAEKHAWGALVASLAVIATLIVLLVRTNSARSR